MKIAQRATEPTIGTRSVAVEVSIVMPCLNEVETLAACIAEARDAIAKGGFTAEIIVADNGSTDGSQLVARELGANVVEVQRKGYDIVVGNRFLGGIEPGAMPWSHRWLGNPVLSSINKIFFHAPVGDTHCGLRAFTKDAYERMRLRATGMEFASEMVIKASLKGMRITEAPVVLH